MSNGMGRSLGGGGMGFQRWHRYIRTQMIGIIDHGRLFDSLRLRWHHLS